jgi:glycosyltransferase involved in cell wall biosynthesis
VATRLAIVCTHPIQYFAPVFAALAQRPGLDVKVFYGWRGLVEPGLDRGFGREFAWDIPLLEGYDHEFVENVSADPGSHHFRGIDLPRLPAAIGEWQADAVLVYGWCYKAHLQAMRAFKGRIPVLFRGDSTLLDERPGPRTWLRRRVLRWVYRHVDVALYVGTNNREYFRAHGLRDDQLVFAPHAVDNERFACRNEVRCCRTQFRAQLELGEEDVVVLLPGKLEPVKSPVLLARAVQRLSDVRCHLVFAGSGPLESELRDFPPSHTHFLGFQNQTIMPSVYAMADLVALPSRSETWGLALNEAMASGRAVLASDRVGAAADLVRPGENGWIFPSGSEVELTGCLREAVAAGHAGLARMGQASRAIIADWSIEKQVDGIQKAIPVSRRGDR